MLLASEVWQKRKRSSRKLGANLYAPDMMAVGVQQGEVREREGQRGERAMGMDRFGDVGHSGLVTQLFVDQRVTVSGWIHTNPVHNSVHKLHKMTHGCITAKRVNALQTVLNQPTLPIRPYRV